MITTYYGAKIRVACPVGREGHNYLEIDAALSDAMVTHEAKNA